MEGERLASLCMDCRGQVCVKKTGLGFREIPRLDRYVSRLCGMFTFSINHQAIATGAWTVNVSDPAVGLPVWLINISEAR